MAWTTPATFTSGAILTAAQMNTNVRDNTNALYDSVKRLAFQSTTNFVATGASVALANEVFTDVTYTAAGSVTYRVEVFLPYIATATNAGSNIRPVLTDGGTGTVASFGYVGTGNGTQGVTDSVYGVFWDAPAAGTRTLNVRGVHGTAAGNIGGLAADSMTAFIAVYGPFLI